MSKRSRAAYYASIERVYSHCQRCNAIGARFSKKDQKQLCAKCRKAMSGKKVNFSGPELCEKAIQHERDLIAYLRSAGLSDGLLETIDGVVDTIRYASYVAGSWEQQPIQNVVRFDPVGT